MSTRKYAVEFLGILFIHAPGKDLTVTVEYSNSFRTQPGDDVVLIPVEWKSLSERRSTLQPRNSTSFDIPTTELSCDDPETTFHFLYVQNGVVFGASNPFLVGIPCDEDSLACESIDSYTILVHSGQNQEAEKLPKSVVVATVTRQGQSRSRLRAMLKRTFVNLLKHANEVAVSAFLMLINFFTDQSATSAQMMKALSSQTCHRVAQTPNRKKISFK